MLGKSNFIVACLLAGSSSAVLNSDKVNAYQRHLAESRKVTPVRSTDKINDLTLSITQGDKKSGSAGSVTLPTGESIALKYNPPKKPDTPSTASLPTYKPPAQKPRNPIAMCKQYVEPKLFQECIYFYVAQNEKITPPSQIPSGDASGKPSGATKPSGDSSGKPSGSTKPTGDASGKPSSAASGEPSGTAKPSGSLKPSDDSSGKPSGSQKPSGEPSGSLKPSGDASGKPSGTTKPSGSGDVKPAGDDSGKPSSGASGKPSGTVKPSESGADGKPSVSPKPAGESSG